VHGNTMVTPFSTIGTGGSRSATMGAGAALSATRVVREQVLAIAAKLLEASEDDLDIVDGHVHVKGTPSIGMTLGEIAMRAYMNPSVLPEGIIQGIEGIGDFRIPDGGWAQATHACIVDVDVATGRVSIVRYVVSEDCGTIIHPAIVDGQVRGGVAQGIAGVLYEHAAYGPDGQFLASTFMDYLMPTAAEVPFIEIDHVESPPTHEVNFRGVGEGGAIGAPPAVSSAIEDALAPFGVRVTEHHLPPTRLLELIGVISPQPRNGAM
jgi:carbon-monoxide dehydrogenase large subunit